MPKAYQIIPSSCVELSIMVCGKRYLADLRVDGLIEDQLEFDTERQLRSWAGAILGTTGGNLYVHVQSLTAYNRRLTLELVGKLSLEGMTIGISGLSPVCRSTNRRLQ
jgi:hypothetical protein